MPAPARILLSKTKFVAGLQCLKRLYLQVHRPELAERAEDAQYARLEQGREVGLLAQRRFPGGISVGFENGPDDAVARTAALLEDSSVPAIYEATFRHSNVLVRIDILQRRPGHRWRLIEVKSSVEPKPHYVYDVAIQHHVVAACGLDISSACLVYLNRDYVYNGQEHVPNELFVVRNLTKQIKKLATKLPELLMFQRKVLAQNAPPAIDPGRQCSAPFRCEFFNHCNPKPPEHHISFLPRLSEKKWRDLVEQGFTLIHEIPEDFPLTEIQSRVCAAVKTGRSWVSETLQEELSALEYPLYYMDFESLYPAIPRFAGMWPYAQIPFQWSVHRQLVPNGEGEHLEHLADDDRDPRPNFIESLCHALGRHGRIVVYNSGFESQRLRELAEWLPAFQGPIASIQERLWDLWPFIKQHVYHPAFNGSFSLKSVLPALVPDLTYSGMEVSHGGEAGLAWEQMVRGGVDSIERERLKASLLAYCRQDTLAMVRVIDSLKSFTSEARCGD